MVDGQGTAAQGPIAVQRVSDTEWRKTVME